MPVGTVKLLVGLVASGFLTVTVGFMLYVAATEARRSPDEQPPNQRDEDGSSTHE